MQAKPSIFLVPKPLELEASVQGGRLILSCQPAVWRERPVPYILRKFIVESERKSQVDTFEQHLLIKRQADLDNFIHNDPMLSHATGIFFRLKAECQNIFIQNHGAA